MTEVTVCITTFNRWHQCFKCLMSVYRQLTKGLEIILVDDDSTEPMPNYVEEFIDSNNIIYVKHAQNLGLAQARNTAIKIASGQYFSFCDDDDEWPPLFLKRLLAAIENGPNDLGVAIALIPECCDKWGEFFSGYPTLRDVMINGFTPPVSSQIYKTQFLHKIGGYNAQIKSGVDHDLWISLSALNPRLAVTWGDVAIVGNDPYLPRITNHESRKYRILESLKIWEPTIVEAFGKDFYDYFCQSYDRHLNYASFIGALRKKKYLLAISFLGKPKVLQKFSRAIVSMIFTNQKQFNVFRTYKKRVG